MCDLQEITNGLKWLLSLLALWRFLQPLKNCGVAGKEKPSEKRKAACAVTMAQAAFLPSGEFAEVTSKYQLYAENHDYLLKTTYVVGISSGCHEVFKTCRSIRIVAGMHTALINLSIAAIPST